MKIIVGFNCHSSLGVVQVLVCNSRGSIADSIETRADLSSCRALARDLRRVMGSVTIQTVELKDPRSIAKHIIKWHRFLVYQQIALLDS